VQKKRSMPEIAFSPKRQNVGGSSSEALVRRNIPPSYGNPRKPRCSTCRKSHLGVCKIGTNNCYRCGETGHYARECPMATSGSQGPLAIDYQPKQPTQACVYSFTPGNVPIEENNANIVTGTTDFFNETVMANPNASTLIVSSESSEEKAAHIADSSKNMLEPSLSQQSRSTSDGPVAILWDIENCPVPSDVRPEDVGGNIRMALRVHPVIKGAVMMFSAYGDFNAFPRRLREGCQRTGVKLIDVPNGRKDAADKAILVDMFLFALDNPPPSSIMLISGDVDFSPALHILGQRGYTVILVIPSGVGVSSALTNAGKFVWDWPSVARGEGFVPLTNV